MVILNPRLCCRDHLCVTHPPSRLDVGVRTSSRVLRSVCRRSRVVGGVRARSRVARGVLVFVVGFGRRSLGLLLIPICMTCSPRCEERRPAFLATMFLSNICALCFVHDNIHILFLSVSSALLSREIIKLL